MSAKIPWPGLVRLEEHELRRAFRDMAAHLDGESVSFRWLGKKTADELINITTAAEWHNIRKQILLARRRIAYHERKEITVQRRLDRRAYMRKYMKNYRRKGTTPEGTG